jgi:hypothetical protein
MRLTPKAFASEANKFGYEFTAGLYYAIAAHFAAETLLHLSQRSCIRPRDASPYVS